MNLKYELQKDSFAYGKKRKNSTKTIVTTIVSILSALIIALLVAAMLGYNPFELFVKLFAIGFSDPVTLFSNIGVFCFAGFAFAFASKAGLFNIGISGQMLAAGTFIVFLTTQWIPSGTIPTGAGQLLVLLAGMLVGGLIATIIGAMDVYLKINSVVSSILFNWIIYFVSFFLLATFARAGAAGDPLANSAAIGNEFRLWATDGSGGIWPIVILTLIFGAFMLVVFKFTVFGHKIKSVGLSSDAAKYAGYNVNLIRLSSFAISGAIAGVLACILYTTRSAAVIDLNVNANSIPIEGFNGIAIALIGSNNPIGIFIVSFLFGLFQTSIPGISVPPAYINVLLGLLMVGSALTILIVKYQPWKYFKSFKYDVNYYKQSQNFDNRFDALISKYKSIYHYEKINVFNQFKEKNIIIRDEIKRLNNSIKMLESTNGTVEQRDALIEQINVLVQKRIAIKTKVDEIWNLTLDNITQDYCFEREDLHEAWKVLKIQMLFDKNFTYEKIVEEKELKIQNMYDTALTKHVSQLKDSGKDMTDKINESVVKSNEWKEEKIAKMKAKQSKALVDEVVREKVLAKIAIEIAKIHDLKKQSSLLEKVESLRTYKGGQ